MSNGNEGPSIPLLSSTDSLRVLIDNHTFYLYKKRNKHCHLYENCKISGILLKCLDCHIVVHRECLVNISIGCKNENLSQSTVSSDLHHHWVPRYSFDRELSYKCSFCLSTTNSLSITDKTNSCPGGKFVNSVVCYTVLQFRVNSTFTRPHDSKKIKQRYSATLSSAEKEVTKTHEHPLKSVGTSPIVVFVNTGSGSNRGHLLMRNASWLLSSVQVIDMKKEAPAKVLESVKHLRNLTLLVCGGDGTVCWILQEIDKVKFETQPKIAIIPLGTGNDLARCLNWGKAFSLKSIARHLEAAVHSPKEQLDRWNIDIEYYDSDLSETEKKKTLSMQNYFSIGIDAEVSLSFHEWRKKSKQKASRFRNKAYYAKAGGSSILKNSFKNMFAKIGVFTVNGQDNMKLLTSERPSSILFLNIPSYSSGTNPWKSSKTMPQSLSDQKLELILMQRTDMIKIQIGGSGNSVMQCSEAVIIVTDEVPIQVDGEPFVVRNCKISLTYKCQATFIKPEKPF